MRFWFRTFFAAFVFGSCPIEMHQMGDISIFDYCSSCTYRRFLFKTF